MMKKDGMKGNSIAQYAIIIGLVVLVVAPGFIILGDRVVKYLSNLNQGLGGDAAPSFQSVANSSSGNSLLPGTQQPAVPVTSTCEGDNCTIQIGEVELKDVTKNMAEMIESTGTSGGTEHLASLLQQVAEGVKDDPNISADDKSKVDYLASLAYQISEKEKAIETFSDEAISVFSDCLDTIDTEQLKTMSSLQRENYIDEKLMPFQELIANDTEMEGFYDNLIGISGNSLHGELLDQRIHAVSAEAKELRRNFDDTLQELTTSSSLNPQLQSVVKVLGDDVADMADNMFRAFRNEVRAKFFDNDYEDIMNDIFSDMSGNTNESNVDALSEIVEPFQNVGSANDGLTSEQTNLDARLIDVSEDKTVDANPNQNQEQNTEEVTNQVQNTESEVQEKAPTDQKTIDFKEQPDMKFDSKSSSSFSSSGPGH